MYHLVNTLLCFYVRSLSMTLLDFDSQLECFLTNVEKLASRMDFTCMKLCAGSKYLQELPK